MAPLQDIAAVAAALLVGTLCAIPWVLTELLRLIKRATGAGGNSVRTGAPHRTDYATGEAAVPDTYLNPRWGTHSHVRANGILFHIVSKGATDAPLMLCLHGFPECWYSWRYTLETFSDTHRVVAVDLRGYGETAHAEPSWFRAKEYAMEQLVTDIAELVRALGHTSCVLVAHDWGGMVGWGVAAAHPQLVRSLIIMDAPHPLAFTRNLTLTQALKSAYISVFQLPWLPELLVSSDNFRMIRNALTGPSFGVRRKGPLTLTDEDVAVYRWVFSRSGTPTAALNYYRNLATTNRAWMRRVNFKDLRMPVLVVWGENDAALGPELNAGLSRYCKDARVCVLPNASHWVQQDAVLDTLYVCARFLGVAPAAITDGLLAPDGTTRVKLTQEEKAALDALIVRAAPASTDPKK